MKQAIVVVSFGTTHKDAEQSAIAPVERAIGRAFPDWEVCRAWTSRIIARRLAERGEPVENEAEALERLTREGCGRVVLAATHIIPGREYGLVKAAAGAWPVSAPLLETEEDLRWMAALLDGIAAEEGRTLLVMGHGTEHAADETYARLRKLLPERVKLACVEGSHDLEGLLPELDALPEKKLTLMPLMLVAGDHAKNDLAGEGPDSWKGRLEARGFDIAARLQGLGALEAVQERFVQKVRSAVE
ncbi:MAG: sirohydrochlorin cobaltochelatase [Clostridia bacterium]|nr:sirohydrochlorin cobaltochelatase [Clostridia bacterium]